MGLISLITPSVMETGVKYSVDTVDCCYLDISENVKVNYADSLGPSG